MQSDLIYKKDGYIFSELQAGNEPTSLTPLQSFLAPHTDRIEIILWTLWVTVLLYVVWQLIKISKSNNNSSVGNQ